MLSASRRKVSRPHKRSFAGSVGEGLMEKVSSLSELKERLKDGFKAELLYNYNTGSYEVPTWIKDSDGTVHSHKTFKFPKAFVNRNDLIRMVYGK